MFHDVSSNIMPHALKYHKINAKSMQEIVTYRLVARFNLAVMPLSLTEIAAVRIRVCGAVDVFMQTVA